MAHASLPASEAGAVRFGSVFARKPPMGYGATSLYTIEDDGLQQPWFGRVFCNPPYDTALIVRFIRRCVEHRNAVALTFARTDTRLFHELIFPNADSILFIKGRLSFYHVTGEQGGTAGAPSCLIAFNKENTAVLETCGIDGKLVKPRLQ